MYGHVSSNDGKPVFMIKVSAYQGRKMITKDHTAEDGRYDLEITGDMPVTLLFDTHPTLNNAHEWQPSIVTNIMAGPEQKLDRTVSATGHFMEDANCVDTLSAYMFATTLEEGNQSDYAQVALSRLSQMKTPNGVLADTQEKLKAHFKTKAS